VHFICSPVTRFSPSERAAGGFFFFCGGAPAPAPSFSRRRSALCRVAGGRAVQAAWQSAQLNQFSLVYFAYA